MDVSNLHRLAEAAVASGSPDDGAMANFILHVPVGTPGIEADPKAVAQKILDDEGFAQSLACDYDPYFASYPQSGPTTEGEGPRAPQGIRAQIAFVCKKHNCPSDTVQALTNDLIGILKTHGLKAAGAEGEGGESDEDTTDEPSE